VASPSKLIAIALVNFISIHIESDLLANAFGHYLIIEYRNRKPSYRYNLVCNRKVNMVGMMLLQRLILLKVKQLIAFSWLLLGGG